jgi:hypoxanthine phosphoribosyltransferase
MSSLAKLHVLFSRQEIAVTVDRLAAAIGRDYGDKHPLFIGVLKGSFILLADLIRHLDFPLEVDFVWLSSYDQGTQTSGKVEMVHGLSTPVRDRELVVVEDIVDTGLTTAFLLDLLHGQKPASLKICALVDKPSRRRVPVSIDYRGLIAPDKFLVGYGLDHNQEFRNLPDICYIEDED